MGTLGCNDGIGSCVSFSKKSKNLWVGIVRVESDGRVQEAFGTLLSFFSK